MADNSDDKTPEAIKKHKSKLTFEMPGPGGSTVRQQEAEKLAAQDQASNLGERAKKHANIERAKIASTADMERGTKGILSKEMKQATKDKKFER